MEPDPKTRCAKPGFQRQFSEGEICISVDAQNTPPNETADGKSFVMERTFRRCSRKECINTQPKQSTDLIVPPITVTLKEDLNVTPEKYQALINEEIV